MATNHNIRFMRGIFGESRNRNPVPVTGDFDNCLGEKIGKLGAVRTMILNESEYSDSQSCIIQLLARFFLATVENFDAG